MEIAELLAFGVKNKASDLHLSAGLPPMIRVHGDVRRINVPSLSHDDVHGMVYDIMNDGQRKHYEENLECDFSFEIPNLARFPRQCIQPSARCRRRDAYDSVEDSFAGRPECAQNFCRDRQPAARHGAGDRPDRFRQVNHAGGDGESTSMKTSSAIS